MCGARDGRDLRDERDGPHEGLLMRPSKSAHITFLASGIPPGKQVIIENMLRTIWWSAQYVGLQDLQSFMALSFGAALSERNRRLWYDLEP